MNPMQSPNTGVGKKLCSTELGGDFSGTLISLDGCKCTLAQRLTGDGCSVCNPSLAEDYAGKPNGEKCPACGLGMMEDSFGNKWCPDTECDCDY